VNGVPSSAEPIRPGSAEVYWAAWLALTLPLPLITSAVPVAPLRSWPTARGRACPLKVASAEASAAATTMVSAAAMMTRRWAFNPGQG